jgi:hypothetical protein
MKFGKKEIIPINELSGATYGFVSDNIIFVSNAVYTLLQDPQVSDHIFKTVRVLNLNEIIKLQLHRIVSEKGFKAVV